MLARGVHSLFLPSGAVCKGGVLCLHGEYALIHRMMARGLLEYPHRWAPDARITPLGLASYWAHPINWGRSDGPANCHPGRSRLDLSYWAKHSQLDHDSTSCNHRACYWLWLEVHTALNGRVNIRHTPCQVPLPVQS